MAEDRARSAAEIDSLDHTEPHAKTVDEADLYADWEFVTLMATHTRNFRCDDQLWSDAKAAAATEGRTVTDVIVAALRRLVAER